MHVTTVPFPVKSQAVSGGSALIGRCFAHPVIDYALVGGGITIPIFLLLYFFPGLTPESQEITLRTFLLFNGAHFAASTLRLYTKPGAKQEFPFLSWGFPIICLVVVGLGLMWPIVGSNLSALYFTWSPYHYAAQTYGIAVMYAMRSGARLDQHDKTQMWWVCLLPFVYAFLTSTEGGVGWFLSQEWLSTTQPATIIHKGLVGAVTIAMFVLPVTLFWQLHRMRGRKVPLISLLLLITNALWWLGTDYLSAWWWTAMFHSIQYLIIVVVQHVKEQMARTDVSGPLHRPFVYGSKFYGISFVLGGVLFFIVPLGYTAFGFDATQSFIVMVSVINLHHFIVDGFIWRTKPSQGKPIANAHPPEQIAVHA